ncbi:unnamed protein product [Amoebophrya sp. A25]|nr:unnamed protein product [Amoebophrya sp. A25]|eukprot:GSA25T00007003001.1
MLWGRAKPSPTTLATTSSSSASSSSCSSIIGSRTSTGMRINYAPSSVLEVWSHPSTRTRTRTRTFSSSASTSRMPLVDPRGPLFASRREQRYFDDPAVRAPVLERNNTGMGYLCLNAEGLPLDGVNSLITKMRDLEVNTTKRFVVLSHNMDDTPEARMRRKALGQDEKAGFVFNGLNEEDYLLLGAAASSSTRSRSSRTRNEMIDREDSWGSSSSRSGNQSSQVLSAYLTHYQELTHLLSDYRKPLVSFFPGCIQNEATALLALSELSAVCATTKIKLPDLHRKVLFGGLSLVLSQNPVARFCAFSQLDLEGPDIVYAGLAKHWMSPEALELMQITAEKIAFNLTEKDGRLLLDEHFLALPPPSAWMQRRMPLMQAFFRKGGDHHGHDHEGPRASWQFQGRSSRMNKNIRRVENYDDREGGSSSPPFLTSWTRIVNGWHRSGLAHVEKHAKPENEPAQDDAINFLQNCVDHFQSWFSDADHEHLERNRRSTIFALNWVLLHEAAKCRGAIEKAVGGKPKQEDERSMRFNARFFMDKKPASRTPTLEEHNRLVDILALPEILELELRGQNLLHSGKLWTTDVQNSLMKIDHHGSISTALFAKVHLLFSAEKEAPGIKMSAMQKRREFPVSAHPLIRQYHPDYDEKTGSDLGDRGSALAEQERFDSDYLSQELMEAKKQICPQLVTRWRG